MQLRQRWIPTHHCTALLFLLVPNPLSLAATWSFHRGEYPYATNDTMRFVLQGVSFLFWCGYVMFALSILRPVRTIYTALRYFTTQSLAQSRTLLWKRRWQWWSDGGRRASRPGELELVILPLYGLLDPHSVLSLHSISRPNSQNPGCNVGFHSDEWSWLLTLDRQFLLAFCSLYLSAMQPYRNSDAPCRPFVIAAAAGIFAHIRRLCKPHFKVFCEVWRKL